MPIEYYIGIAVGIFSVLFAYVISELTRRDSKCDKCIHLSRKRWSGKIECENYIDDFLFPPKYCCRYTERKDEHE